MQYILIWNLVLLIVKNGMCMSYILEDLYTWLDFKWIDAWILELNFRSDILLHNP